MPEDELNWFIRPFFWDASDESTIEYNEDGSVAAIEGKEWSSGRPPAPMTLESVVLECREMAKREREAVAFYRSSISDPRSERSPVYIDPQAFYEGGE